MKDSHRALKKFESPKITSTCVWRVSLCCEAIDKYVELLVLCDELIPGEKFQKAVEDTFLLYLMSGKIPDGYPDTLSEYVVKMTNCMGLAAGCVKPFTQKGVSIALMNNGVPVMIDGQRLSNLAGLNDPELVKREEKRIKEEKRVEESEKTRRETLEAQCEAANAVIAEALLDTALHMPDAESLKTIEAQAQTMKEAQYERDLAELLPSQIEWAAKTDEEFADYLRKRNGGEQASTG